MGNTWKNLKKRENCKMSLKFLNWILGNFTGCYNYGKRNAVHIIRNGKKHKCFFMPRGLTVIFDGDDSTIDIEKPNRFYKTTIHMEGSGAMFSLKRSGHKVKEAKFCVEENSKILIGENVQMKNSGLVVIANNAYKEPIIVSIGDNTYIARDVLIRTSDGHTIINAETKEALNPPKNVIIDEHAWIGSRAVLLKGAHIPKNSIVGACALVTKSFDEENVVIAGQPAKIIKHNVSWDRRAYGTYLKQVELVKENT